MPTTVFNETAPGKYQFVVTQTGTYKITAFGAQGGAGATTGGVAGGAGGLGTEAGGTFFLTQGETITVVVGGQGLTPTGSVGGGGGGGGSFVIETNSGSGAVHTPLVIAGGGGGGAAHTFFGSNAGGGGQTTAQGGNGLLGPVGTYQGAGSPAYAGAGGANGAGGHYGGSRKSGAGGGGYSGGSSALGAIQHNGGGPGTGYGGGGGEAGANGGYGGGGGGSAEGDGGGGGGFGGGGGGGLGYAGHYGAGGGGGGGSLDNGTNQILVGAQHAGNGAVTIEMVCYVRGTHIATPDGEVAVEALCIGDPVVVRAGDAQQIRPVKWIGWRQLALGAHPQPDRVAPIRIQRGAFADNVPHRDLLVSPDHAILVDGKLVCARQLINRTTIRQDCDLPVVDYYHVELDDHAVLLAEGLTAESYLDTGNRGFFANSGEPLVLHPDLSAATEAPTRADGSCAPFVWAEDDVQPIWQRLAERAAIMGHAAQALDVTEDAHLCLVTADRILQPLSIQNGLHCFILPKGTRTVRIVSRSASPTYARPWLEDRRQLGVYVERITVRTNAAVHDVSLDDPTLARGWWAVERAGMAMRRWTNGDANLPIPLVDGPIQLQIRATTAGMTYPLSADRSLLASYSTSNAAMQSFHPRLERSAA
jgi:hypothetical protein